MKVSDLETIQKFKRINEISSDVEISTGYTSDLLSDVMANAPEDSVFITIQAHKNSIAVAQLVGIPAIVICNGREIPQEMIDAANDEDITLFQTELTQFEASCKIGEHLN